MSRLDNSLKDNGELASFDGVLVIKLGVLVGLSAWFIQQLGFHATSSTVFYCAVVLTTLGAFFLFMLGTRRLYWFLLAKTRELNK